MRYTHLKADMKYAQHALRYPHERLNNDHMTVGANIRRIRQARHMTLLSLANQAESDVGNLSRLERDKQGYSDEMLKKIADALGVKVAEFFHEESTVVPVGSGGVVPLISWEQAAVWGDDKAPPHLGDIADWIACPAPHSASAYALRVVGDSMDGPGGYREDEIIFVDPRVKPTNGKDVVIRDASQRVILRRLKSDGGDQYLLALNPSWPERIRLITDEMRICGTIVGSFIPR